jgi:pilus assembly protein FimV
MKGSTKLTVAIALALIGGNAFALGLGAIQVKSKLNQPLEAEIQVLAENAADTAGLDVKLATAEDFQRVGLDRGRVAIPIDFSVSTNSRGQSVIKVTSKDAVREPLLDFLVEVNWAKGKLLREYSVLLDPPVVAPTRTAAAPAPVREAPAAAPAEKIVAEPKAKPTPTKVKPPHPVAEAKPEKPAPAPKPTKPAAAPRAAASGEYGPVAEGETLTEIARSTRPDDATNINEMMLALLKANPSAFYKDNINALKRGAILRIPSRDDVKATGSAAEAAAAVHEQNQAWSGKAPVAKPTVVATTGTPSKTPEAPAAKPAPAKTGEHLALVPPAAGKGGQGASDHPGTATGTAGGTDSKAELARVKEALTSREQEVTELKSRVKDLEKINGDDQRLLTLKQNEIADLQKKLKELESKAAAAPGKPAASAPATAVTAPASKPAETPAATPAKPAETPAATATKPGEAAKPADAGKTPPNNLTAKDIWGSISAGESKPGTPASTATAPTSAPSAGTPAATSAPASPATTSSATPAASTPATTPATKPEEPKPTSTATPLKPTTAPKVTPIAPPAEEPWWQNQNYLYGGGIGLLVIGLLALMRLFRKPKAELPAMAGAAMEHAGAGVDEEQQLFDDLRRHPGDPQVSLQLLSLYYANRDAHKFEAAAETMYAHVADPTQPEWQEVRRMGEDLVPSNPLFGGHDDIAQAAGTGWPHHDHMASAHEPQHLDAGTHAHDTPAHDQGFDLGPFDTHTMAKPAAEESFDFDLTDSTAAAATAAAHPTPPPPPAYTPPPPPAYTPPPAPKPVAAPPPPAPAAKPADDFFGGDDAIGTKLDLAKAYLDMGDPEGARSMLDEVMAEGSDAQKSEARKLLAEIK